MLRPRMPHVDNREHRCRKAAAIAGDAGKRYARNVGAVIGALTRHKHSARGLLTHAMIKPRNLDRRIDRLRTGAGEEETVQ